MGKGEEGDSISTKSEGDENTERGNWGGKLDFILTAVGYAVGLGNVWRFPYKTYRNGGGAFLIPYAFMLAFAGLPLFFLELSFGQFTSEGPLTCWKISPFWKGLGYGMVVISALVSIYYNVIIAWTLYYFVVSFTTELPWQTCDHPWNTQNCRYRWTSNYTVDVVNRTEMFNHTGWNEHLTGRANAFAYNNASNSSISTMAVPAYRNQSEFNYYLDEGLISKNVSGALYMCANQTTYVFEKLCGYCKNMTILLAELGVTDTAFSDTFNQTSCQKLSSDANMFFTPRNLTHWFSIGVDDYRFKNVSNFSLPSLISASEEYWDREVLGRTEGIHDPGVIQWKLALALFVAWALIFACLSKGVKTSGKVVYFTATFPYVVLVILLIRGVTLEGAGAGIIWYLTPQWEHLLSPQVYGEAATQIFYSLGPAFGGLITMASYNNFRNNCYRDALIVSILNCSTSVFAGFVIFSLIGFMAEKQGVTDPGKVIAAGPGLAFVAYPEGIAQMPFLQPFWSVLFFFMLLTLGLDSQFVMMETVISAIVDEYPKFWRPRKIWLTLLLCIIMFILGLSNVTQGGVYVFQLLDWYSASFSLLIIAFFELIVINWIYGYNNFADDINLMLGFRPNLYWRICWQFFTPTIIVGILIFSIIQYQPATYNTYVYPPLADAIGWVMVFSSVLCVPLYMIYYFCSWIGFGELVKPADNWGPYLDKYRTGRYATKDLSNGNPNVDTANSVSRIDGPPRKSGEFTNAAYMYDDMNSSGGIPYQHPDGTVSVSVTKM